MDHWMCSCSEDNAWLFWIMENLIDSNGIILTNLLLGLL
jgi:hypothetical protein